MNEIYVECLVERKRDMVAYFVRCTIYVLAALIALAGIVIDPFLIVIAIAIAALAYFLCPSPDVEFEYLYLDRELTIDKVMAKQSRKRVAAYNLDNMRLFCKKDSFYFDSYRNRKLKETDYSSKLNEDNVYALVIAGDKGEEIVYLEPNADFINALKQVYPRVVSL